MKKKTNKLVTAGAAAIAAAQEDTQASANDIKDEALKDFEMHIGKCIDEGYKSFPSDFYVVVETKKEPLLPNVIRNYFFCRESCPTPSPDNTVYQFHRSSSTLMLLWVIPSKLACEMFRDRALEIPSEQKELLGYVLDFFDGTLFRLAKKLNGEKIDSPLLEK